MRFCSRASLIVRDGEGFAALQSVDSPSAPATVPSGVGRLIAPASDGGFGDWIVRDVST